MKNRRFLLATLIILLSLATAGRAENTKNFVAPLKDSNEVPPRDTGATGLALFHLVNDGTELYYKVIVANVHNVTASHIHLGAAGANGGVVAFLFGGPTTSGRTQGILAEGTITDADLIGALGGLTLADLIEEIEAGNAYVNVHTTQFPGGEIRGQIQ
ncbi:MAG: CHRD domain-containing protein [Acidobacteriota bacterium]|nr:CHRD domain-containing protein [Acidobacteriota bacterium]MDQ5871121.1 CHRD domain-containing protein [Acidobacteriota bacterium]